MPKQSTNASPYNYDFRRMLKKKYHLKNMDEANALANELYKREMANKTKAAIEAQEKTGAQHATVDFGSGIRGSALSQAEIVDIQLDEDNNKLSNVNAVVPAGELSGK